MGGRPRPLAPGPRLQHAPASATPTLAPLPLQALPVPRGERVHGGVPQPVQGARGFKRHILLYILNLWDSW
jgi:hypothetical protein